MGSSFINNTRRVNIVGFDHETAVKRNLPIIDAITTVDLPDGTSVQHYQTSIYPNHYLTQPHL
jgi:hypothetical protein